MTLKVNKILMLCISLSCILLVAFGFIYNKYIYGDETELIYFIKNNKEEIKKISEEIYRAKDVDGDSTITYIDGIKKVLVLKQFKNYAINEMYRDGSHYILLVRFYKMGHTRAIVIGYNENKLLNFANRFHRYWIIESFAAVVELPYNE